MMIGKSGMGVGSKWVMMAAVILVAGVARADSFGVGQPGIGGSGCPQGTAYLTAGPFGGDQVRIEFDQYEAALDGVKGNTFDRKNCSIALPLSIPQGFRAVLSDLTAEGSVSLPKGVVGQFETEAFQAGSVGPKYMKTFKGGGANSGQHLSFSFLKDLVRTGCGQEVILRLNSAALLKSKGSHLSGSLKFDSFAFTVALEPCAP